MRIPTNQPVKWNASQGVLNVAQFVNPIFMDTFRQTKIAMEHPPFFLVNTIKEWWIFQPAMLATGKMTGSSGPQTAKENTESDRQGLGRFTGRTEDKLRDYKTVS